MNSIFHRVSVRRYMKRPIEHAKLERIVQAGMTAPSAGNGQPWEYYVVEDRKLIKALSCSTPYASCAKDAPVVFVACYRKDCSMPEYAHIDMSASVENVLLEIDEIGLGGVWLGVAPMQERMDEVRRILDMPENLEAFAIIPCGYPCKIEAQENRYQAERVHYIKDPLGNRYGTEY